MTKHCYDERHETPCPLPCEACEDECDPATFRLTPSEQARADAMADAETLLRISYTEPKDWAADAYYSGGYISWALSRDIPRGEIGYVDASPDYMAVCAESAARAAFRAVPGLRGDR